MKKIVKVLAVVLVVTLSLVLLCGCSSYNKLKGVCEKEGFKEIRDVVNYFDAFDTEEGKKFKEEMEKSEAEMEKQMKEAGLEVKVYSFVSVDGIEKDVELPELMLKLTANLTKGGAMIVEFKSTKALEDAIKENEDLKNFIKENGEEIKDTMEDIDSLPFVNGNCIFFALGNGLQSKLDEA